LTCTVAGKPMPTVTFTSQGQPVTSELDGHKLVQNRLIVEKSSVRTEYTCEANSIQGSDTKTVSGIALLCFNKYVHI